MKTKKVTISLTAEQQQQAAQIQAAQQLAPAAAALQGRKVANG